MSKISPTERLQSLAAAGWSDVCDRILAGLCHDLNGRVTSLAGMVQLLQLDEDSASMAPFLDQEVVRLEGSVRMVRRLAGEPDEDPEPLHLPEIFPELVDLFGKHRHLESLNTTLTFQEGLLPVVSGWTLLSRCFLLTLSLAGHEALGRGRKVDVEVSPGDDGSAHIVARAEGGRDDSIMLPPVAARAEGMEPLVQQMGGSFRMDISDDSVMVTMSLPMMGQKRS